MNLWKPNAPQHTDALDGTDLVNAVNTLNIKTPFTQLNRRYVDPPIANQQFALLSFIPTVDAKPDTDGFYGFVKIRGVFATIQEADAQAEDIIRNVDSCNSIFTCNVGRPVPLCVKGHAESLNEIDLQQKTEETIAKNVREKRMKEKQEIEDIKAREKALKQDVKEPDPEDEYVTKRVKLATLKFTFEEHKKKAEECDNLRKKCEKDLISIRKEHPEYEERYMQRYLDGRKKANIPDDAEMPGFMKYMKDTLE
jgi:hypothetical protein